MRILLGLVLAAGVLWGGYWFVGARVLDRQVNAWFDAQVAAGAEVGREALTVAGFPNRFDVTLTAPYARDPQTGWGWRAPFAQVFSMTWKPWHMIAALAPEQQITAPDGQTLLLKSARLRGSLLLKPGLDLALNRAVLEGEALDLISDRGGHWAVDKLVLAAGVDATWANGMRLGVEAQGLAPDPARLAPVADLGPTLAETHLDMTLQLQAPVDRHLTAAGFGVTAVHLTDAHLAWGPLVVSARGNLSRGPDGSAEGEIAITIDHWQRLPDALMALGLLRVAEKPWVERALTLFAGHSDVPDRVQVSLVSKGGQMTLGGLPLGRTIDLPVAALPQE